MSPWLFALIHWALTQGLGSGPGNALYPEVLQLISAAVAPKSN